MASNVVTTVHSEDAHRCVKILREADVTFGYREFRRDPEDAGGWTMVSDNGGAFANAQQAAAAAADRIAWLSEMQSKAPDVIPHSPPAGSGSDTSRP